MSVPDTQMEKEIKSYCPIVETTTKKVIWGFLFSEVHHEVWVERNTEIQN